MMDFVPPEEEMDAAYVSWQSYHGPRIHYVHGALHLFDAGHELQKYTWSRTDIPIIEQIRAALEEERYPLFVSEGHTETKLARIMHSGYLHKALRSLEGIGGSMFIFGHSLHSDDEHVLRAIENNQTRQLYVSLYEMFQAISINTLFSGYEEWKVFAQRASVESGLWRLHSLTLKARTFGIEA